MSFRSILVATLIAAAPMPSALAIGPISSPNITTFAGNGAAAFAGDGGPATAASINIPVAVATDPAGNVYIADQFNHRVRKVDLTGTITTVVGAGTAGFTGDGGQALQAQLNTPTCVFVDAQGDLIICDVGNQRIRKVTPAGVISTVAGTGAQGYSGDGGPATSAMLYNAVRAIADSAGNLYIADQSNHRIRKVDTSGIITTFAGTGAQSFSGDGGAATAAALNNPTSLARDSAGNLYLCDQFNHRIRMINSSGVITTIAGTGTPGYSGDGGPALSAELNYPGGMTIDSSGNLFFSDDTNYRVRVINASGTIDTVAGNGTQGFSGDGGPATSASLNGEFGVAVDPAGNLLIADSQNNRIRIVAAVSSVAPAFTSNAVTNGASFVSGGSAGALATVFGSHLSVNLSGVINASTVPLPLTLGGSSITVNGTPAPLLAVVNVNGQEQINFQIPWEAAGSATVQVIVNNGVAASAAVPVALTEAQPGIFLIDSVDGAIEHVDGSVVTAANPAAPGETIVVFATGLGPVSPALITGAATPGTALTSTTLPFTATIGGAPATVQFSGEAPFFVGLGQLNIQVPAGAASGAQPLVITSSSFGSNTVQIQVK